MRRFELCRFLEIPKFWVPRKGNQQCIRFCGGLEQSRLPTNGLLQFLQYRLAGTGSRDLIHRWVLLKFAQQKEWRLGNTKRALY